jgi:hypothetical protein
VTLVRDDRGGLVKGLPYRLDGQGAVIERARPDLGSTPRRSCASCWATTMPSWRRCEGGRDRDDADVGDV